MPKRNLYWGLAALATVFVALQFVPVPRAVNPPVEEEIVASPAVMGILRRSCFDCHSNQTRFPWYSRVAPASWLVSHDVIDGRDHLNFSTWNRYDVGGRAELWEEILEAVFEGTMPPRKYTPLHPGTRLTAADRATLEAWARRYADYAAAVPPE
jgi:hypothetical protein